VAREDGKPLIVHFDQNCINVLGRDVVLNRLDAFDNAGRIELQVNPRNKIELGTGRYAASALQKMAGRPVGAEVFRLDVSPMDTDDVGFAGDDDENPLTEFSRLWSLIFPTDPSPGDEREWTEREEHCVNDVLHVANAEDSGADVLLTRDGAMLRSRENLGLKVRVLSPEELVAELEAQGEPNGT